jgi:hypothetical protein
MDSVGRRVSCHRIGSFSAPVWCLTRHLHYATLLWCNFQHKAGLQSPRATVGYFLNLAGVYCLCSVCVIFTDVTCLSRLGLLVCCRDE